MTNLTSALAADAVWFNSAFHRDSFLRRPGGLAEPHARLSALRGHRAESAAKSEVHPPGVASVRPARPASARPLRILWAARWEHDKNPEDFFAAIERLKDRRIPFRISVIGEQFREVPEVFARARQQLRRPHRPLGLSAGPGRLRSRPAGGGRLRLDRSPRVLRPQRRGGVARRRLSARPQASRLSGGLRAPERRKPRVSSSTTAGRKVWPTD